jgi:hypothetical protein
MAAMNLRDRNTRKKETRRRRKKERLLSLTSRPASSLKNTISSEICKNAQETIPSLTQYLIFNSITNSAAVMLMEIVKLRC